MWLLLDIALLVDGISRMIRGIRVKQTKGWSKNFGKGAEALPIIFKIAILVYTDIGLAIAGLLIGIALLITSIQ